MSHSGLEVQETTLSLLRLETVSLPSYPEKLLAGAEIARTQRMALLTDLDDTYVTGCLEQHMKYAYQFATRLGYTGPHPTHEDLRVHGTVQRFYEPHLPEIVKWADHLRGSRRFHRGLPPMHPNFELVFAQLEQLGLLPSLGLTARPDSLTDLSEEVMQQYSGYQTPVLAMPNEIPLAQTSEWKLDSALQMDQLLEHTMQVVLLDDSERTVKLINSLSHPRVSAFLFTNDEAHPSSEPKINWDSADRILDEHVARFHTHR